MLHQREPSSDLPIECLCAFCFIHSEIKLKVSSVVSLGIKKHVGALQTSSRIPYSLSKGCHYWGLQHRLCLTISSSLYILNLGLRKIMEIHPPNTMEKQLLLHGRFFERCLSHTHNNEFSGCIYAACV